MTDPTATVREALADQPLVDTHNDWALVLRKHAGSAVSALDTARPEFQTDIPRLRAGRVGVQFWAASVPANRPEPESALDIAEQLDLVLRIIARYPDVFEHVSTAQQARDAAGRGRIASILAVEGGHGIANSLGVLRNYARLGVRYLTLTHFTNTSWADSATDAVRSGGLSEDGKALIAELNRIGVLADLSHIAATTAHDALDVSRAPVIFSHSSARAVTDHVRNADDSLLERLPANGGTIQVTFVPAFVSAKVSRWYAQAAEVREQVGLPRRPLIWPGSVPFRLSEEEWAAQFRDSLTSETNEHAERTHAFEKWLQRNPRPEATLDDVVAHVEHLRDVAGIDHIGIGSDFDGSDAQPLGLRDVADFPRLLETLAGRGWSVTDLRKLAGENTLRVLQDAEDAATETLWPRSQKELTTALA